ncbi:MAG: hypothetical protein JXB04_08920 [Kiritimatiellae bacterium]|nr:hypothetical protein [Kiritimatiellia bacterium]
MDSRTEELICKVADGCATPEEEKELAVLADGDIEIARELQAQKDAVSAVRSLGLPELQDRVAAQFWSGVYNRIEHRVGWIFVTGGLVVLLGYGLYELLTEPDISSICRLGIAAVIVGFGLLLSSVLRARMKLRRYDRYEEVMR